MSIVVVGSLAFDSIQTPWGEVDRVLGGSANYFSLSARFFSPVRLVGVIGEDFPQDHLEYLRSENICTEGVERSKGKTFHWKGKYGKDLAEATTLETHLNVIESFQPNLPESYRETDFVFLANFNPDLQKNVVEQVKQPKVIACDTMNYWIEGKLEALKKVLLDVDILFINEGEANLLSGHNNLVKAAKKISTMGPEIVVLKRGEHGALLYNHGKIFIMPAYPLDTIQDPTGAGDSFAGGFMGYLAKSQNPLDGSSLRRAMVYGTIMASFNVEDFSFNRLKTLNWGQIERRYRELLDAVTL